MHLEAAQGWLELGNHEEANEELELIDAPLRSHPDVLEVRWGIYAKVKNWEACLDIGKAMVKLRALENEDLAGVWQFGVEQAWGEG